MYFLPMRENSSYYSPQHIAETLLSTVLLLLSWGMFRCTTVEPDWRTGKGRHLMGMWFRTELDTIQVLRKIDFGWDEFRYTAIDSSGDAGVTEKWVVLGDWYSRGPHYSSQGAGPAGESFYGLDLIPLLAFWSRIDSGGRTVASDTAVMLPPDRIGDHSSELAVRGDTAEFLRDKEACYGRRLRPPEFFSHALCLHGLWCIQRKESW